MTVGSTDKVTAHRHAHARHAEDHGSHGHGPLARHHHHNAHHGANPLVRLIALLRTESRDIGIVVIYSIAVGVLSLAVPITAMAVVNSTAMANLVQQLFVLCTVLFICLAMAMFFRILQTIVVEFLQRRIFARVVTDLAHRLPRVDIRAFDRQHGPELVNRFFAVLIVQKTSATLLLDGIAVVLQTAIGLLLLAFYHQMLLGFNILLIGALLFLVFGLGRGAVSTSIRESLSKFDVAGWMEEMARHPATFKLNGGPEFASHKADELTRSYLVERQSHFAIVMRQFIFALGLHAVASTALLAIGGYLVIVGQLTLGQLVAAEIVVSLVLASFTKLIKHLESYYDLMAAMDKLGHLTDLPLERQTGEELATTERGATIRFTNVRYAYQSALRAAIDDLSLSIEAGERVAVMGRNGCGKSTFVDLLFGLRTPSHGHIEIDGQDLRDLNLESLRRGIALVKGLEIFDGTVLDNLRMGRSRITLEEVRASLRDVGLLDTVLDLPDGLNTVLRTGGGPLSLGQCERLMLARALVGRPRLLILDEALDDMDSEMRREVIPKIIQKNAPWTLIVVTHDEEIANLCDRLINLSRPGH